jgi:hypothetical protein
MFRTQTGQTGRDAYTYELTAIGNEFRELTARLAKLGQTIADEMPDDATGSRAMGSGRKDLDAHSLRRMIEFASRGCDRSSIERMEDLLAHTSDYRPIEPIVRTAQDFQQAAELLTEVEAPSEYEVEALASAQDDLRSEADYLANVDPSEIGSPAVVSRYLATSRASRRHAVIRYMTTARMTQPSPQLRRVLDIIGGEGI